MSFREFVQKYQKIVYIIAVEFIFTIFFSLVLYLVAIPTFGDMGAFDTFYLQYMLILLGAALLNWTISMIFFEKAYLFLIVSVIHILFLGFLGMLLYYLGIEGIDINSLKLIVLIPKFGLYVLIELGIFWFIVIYIVIDVLFKILMIKQSAIEKRVSFLANIGKI